MATQSLSATPAAPAQDSRRPSSVASGTTKKPNIFKRIAQHFRRYWELWLLSAPALIFVAIFAYVPMWGIQLAFRKFDPDKGLTGGDWVGFYYFNQFFHSPLFGEIMTNTIRISLWTLVMGFIYPIILALLINQIHSTKVKGFVQTVTYMPHFISVVSSALKASWATRRRSLPSTGFLKSGSIADGTPSSISPHSPAWTRPCMKRPKSMAQDAGS